MSLTRVTLTGADDAVDPQELVDLSAEFPFVEWAILVSPKRLGTPRYPSWEWMAGLHEALRSSHGVLVDLAAHFCGEATRTTVAGDDAWIDRVHWADRIQLNGYAAPAVGFRQWAVEWGEDNATEFILQVRSEVELDATAVDARYIGQSSLLYDPSGGRGLAVDQFPTINGVRVGYAGGITPENVHHVINAISECRHGSATEPPYWLDMESGVRTNDRFDLRKARAVIERAKPYVGKAE